MPLCWAPLAWSLIGGAVATWNQDLGPHWYSIVIAATVLPCAWTRATLFSAGALTTGMIRAASQTGLCDRLHGRSISSIQHSSDNLCQDADTAGSSDIFVPHGPHHRREIAGVA
jgi:hypothetical protein